MLVEGDIQRRAGNGRAADLHRDRFGNRQAGRRVHALKRAKDTTVGRFDRAHGSNSRFIVVTPARLYVKRVATTGRSSRI